MVCLLTEANVSGRRRVGWDAAKAVEKHAQKRVPDLSSIEPQPEAMLRNGP